MGGWVLFRCDTLTHALGYYQALAGSAPAIPAQHPVAQFLDPLLWHYAHRRHAVRDANRPAHRRVARCGGLATRAWSAASAFGADVAWLAVVGGLSSAFLAAGTYNPFIYFRF